MTMGEDVQVRTGMGGVRETTVPFFQFCCKHNTALKKLLNKVLTKKEPVVVLPLCYP